ATCPAWPASPGPGCQGPARAASGSPLRWPSCMAGSLSAAFRPPAAWPRRRKPAACWSLTGRAGSAKQSLGTACTADTATNAIRAIPGALARHSSAGTGALVTSGGALSAPLGRAIAPGGDVLTVNGGNGKIVETTPAGVQVATRYLDRSGSPQGDGALFGLAVAPRGRGIYYVDDAVNTLRLLS